MNEQRSMKFRGVTERGRQVVEGTLEACRAALADMINSPFAVLLELPSDAGWVLYRSSTARDTDLGRMPLTDISERGLWSARITVEP